MAHAVHDCEKVIYAEDECSSSERFMALIKILIGDHDRFHGVKICMRSLLIIRIVNWRMANVWRSLCRRRVPPRPTEVGRNRR